MGVAGGAKQKMLLSAVALLRERGVGATTVDAVLAHGGSPRGSVYYHFPGGRTELIESSVQFAGSFVAELLDDIADEGDVRTGIERFVEIWRKTLLDTHFRAGCPVLAVAVDQDATPSSTAIVAAIFARWQEAFVRLLVTAGHQPPRARRLATMTVSAIEGAIVLSRVQGNAEPLDEVTIELLALLDRPGSQEPLR